MDFSGFRTFFETATQLITALKNAKDLLPAGSKKEQFESKTNDAVTALGIAKVEAAQALGYDLCQCTFPPTIMLAISYDAEESRTTQCPNCKRLEKIE